MQPELNANPWYKEFWAWFCIGILVFAVVIGLGLLIVGYQVKPTLVVDNYYDVGKGINATKDREQLAAELNLNAFIQFDPSIERVELQLNGESRPQHLVLNLIARTQEEKDRRIVLQPANNDGLYRGLLQDNTMGQLYVELLGQEDGREWRLINRLEQELEPGMSVNLSN